MSVDTVELQELEEETFEKQPVLKDNIEVIKNVKVRLDVRIGQADMLVKEVFSLTEGSVVKLDRDLDAPIDVVLDGRVVARGTLVVADDNFGVRITDINT